MDTKGSYLFVAAMDVNPDKEPLFNEIYDTEHVPFVSEVPGVISAARYERQELTMLIGGERRTIRIEDAPKYAALYEIESPDVLTSEAWGSAVERGRWPEHARPHTRNRRHTLWRLLPRE